MYKIIFYNIFYMYKEKYLKYKSKYLDLKNLLGGSPSDDVIKYQLIANSSKSKSEKQFEITNYIKELISDMEYSIKTTIQIDVLVDLIINQQLTVEYTILGLNFLKFPKIETTIESKDDWLLWKQAIIEKKHLFTQYADPLNALTLIGLKYEKLKNPTVYDTSDVYEQLLTELNKTKE